MQVKAIGALPGSQEFQNIDKTNQNNNNHNPKTLTNEQLVQLEAELYALTRTNIKQQSRPQSRKQSQKNLKSVALAGLPSNQSQTNTQFNNIGAQSSIESNVKNHIQRVIDANSDYLATMIGQASASNNANMITPNHHYFQGHYAKMYYKQIKQMEQQKVQSALIVRNIKTLSKLSDSTKEGSMIKISNEEDIGRNNLVIINKDELDQQQYETNNRIPHSRGLRTKTIFPNEQESDFRESIESHHQAHSEIRNSYNKHQTYDELSNQYQTQQQSPRQDNQNNALEYRRKGIQNDFNELKMYQDETGRVRIHSPDIMKTDRKLQPDEQITQEQAIKSFTEIDMNGISHSFIHHPQLMHHHKSSLSKKNQLAKNQNNNLKLDPFNKFIALSYANQNYLHFDPINSYQSQQTQQIGNNGNEGQTGQMNIYVSANHQAGNDMPMIISQVFNEGFDHNYYPSMLSQIAKQHLINSMHSPSKIKTQKDQIKRSILGLQQYDGAWILEKKYEKQREGKIDDIVIKGQSMPNHLVQGGGVNQLKKHRRNNLQSARGGLGKDRQNYQTSDYQIEDDSSPTRTKQKKDVAQLKDKFKNIKSNDDSITEERELKYQTEFQKSFKQQNGVARPQSKHRQLSQKITSSQNSQTSNNLLRSNKPGVSSYHFNQRNSIEVKLRKNNSIADQFSNKNHLSLYSSKPALQDKEKSEESTKESQKPDSQESQAQDLKQESLPLSQIDENNSISQNASQNNKNTYSFRPRRPLVNPVEQARLEYERMIQMKIEAKEKYQQFSLLNKQSTQKFKYIVCPGNNSQVIKRCLELRQERWEETNDFDTLFNFKWHPVSKGIKFDIVNTHGIRQLVNHFENHDCFTTKDQMFKNFLSYCEIKKLNVFDYVPLTFVIEVDSSNYAYDLEKFIQYFSQIEKQIEQSGKNQSQLLKYQNMIEDILQNINLKFQNFHMNKDERGPIFAKRKIPSPHFQAQNIWILKATGFNRGRGIHVFNKLEDLKKLIKEYTDGLTFENQYNSQQQTNKLINKQIGSQNFSQKDPIIQQSSANNAVSELSQGLRSTSFVIQKYVEKPLLIRKRKFDLRVWVLVCQDAKCYFFKEGYVRTSCEEFTLSQESIAKPQIHLTNNAVQKNNENYGKFEDGNQLSFQDLQDIILEENQNSDKNYVKQTMIPQMKDIIINNLDSVKKKLKITTNQRGQGCCFELFGYDFIIDAEYGLWLIEVNTNPCLEESSQLLQRYIPRMVNDMLRMTVDVVFSQKKGQAAYDSNLINIFPIEGYTNEEIIWEFIWQLEPFMLNENNKATLKDNDKLGKVAKI